MTTKDVSVPLDPAHVADALRQEAVEKVNAAEGEVVLDFSAVDRIDANAVRAMEELVDLADSRSVKVGLRAVNTDVYKVLKLMKLAQRFCFLN
jgi:anti-anti-sigma regulatory factor